MQRESYYRRIMQTYPRMWASKSNISNLSNILIYTYKTEFCMRISISVCLYHADDQSRVYFSGQVSWAGMQELSSDTLGQDKLHLGYSLYWTKSLASTLAHRPWSVCFILSFSSVVSLFLQFVFLPLFQSWLRAILHTHSVQIFTPVFCSGAKNARTGNAGR